MEVDLPALLGNYEKHTNQQTDRKSPRKIKLSREKFTLAAACGDAPRSSRSAASGVLS